MKKTWILLMGALLMTLALQGCTNDDSAIEADPVVDQTPADQPTVPTDGFTAPDGLIKLAEVEIALGGGNGDEPVYNVVQSPLFSDQIDFFPFGLGQNDVQLSGQGIDPGTGYACPNTVDPATGLPLVADPCGAAGARGVPNNADPNLVTLIQADLTLSNVGGVAGDVSACANAPYSRCLPPSIVPGTCQSNGAACTADITVPTAPVNVDVALCAPLFGPPRCLVTYPVPTNCDDNFDGIGEGAACTQGSVGNCTLYANSICTVNEDCLPASIRATQVPGAAPGTFDSNYCMGNRVLLGSGLAGFCTDGATACSDGAGDILPDGSATPCAAVLPALVDTGCYTGCGTCDNTRDLYCPMIQYTGYLQPDGSPSSYDANGLVTCSGGPYTPAGTDPLDIDADTWVIGNAGDGINAGGSASQTISVNTFNGSYCVHYLTVWEDPHGNLNHPECETLCGDGFIADDNTQAGQQERCEPVYDPIFVSGGGNLAHYGCTGIGVDAWNACTDAANCVCDPTDCGSCIDDAGCGNGILDAGEACEPSLGDNCCNPLTCQIIGAGNPDPQAVCAGAPQCNANVCDGTLNGCTTAPAFDGSPCVGGNGVNGCSLADTCNAGACDNNDVVAGTYCTDLGSLSQFCNGDTCDGAGVCTDVANTPDGTSCNPPEGNPGDTCNSGVCGPLPASVVSITSRCSTGPTGTVVPLDGATDPDDGGVNYDGSHLAADCFQGAPNEAGGPQQDIQLFDVITAGGGAMPTCSCSTGAATVFAEPGAPAETWVAYCAGPDLGFSGMAQPSSMPSFAATITPMTVTCTADGGAGLSLGPVGFSIGMAEVSILSKTISAAGGAVTLDATQFCTDNHVDGNGCDRGGFGGVGFAVVGQAVFFDTTHFSNVPASWTTSTNAQGAGTEYGVPCQIFPAAADSSAVAAGTYIAQSSTNDASGAGCIWRLAHTNAINTTANATAAGTISNVRISTWSVNQGVVASRAGVTQAPTSASADGGGTFTAPMTNKHGLIIFQ